jgi:hypothetical protein
MVGPHESRCTRDESRCARDASALRSLQCPAARVTRRAGRPGKAVHRPDYPAGTASVSYRIQAVRSTLSGAPADFTVNFGVGGGGEMTASVVGGAAVPKLAA